MCYSVAAAITETTGAQNVEKGKKNSLNDQIK